MSGEVAAVSRCETRGFSKQAQDGLRLVAGLGVEGDAHAGSITKLRGRWAQGRTKPNLRQVHLIHAELFSELAASGFRISPGEIGENIMTRGIDLLALSTGTRLHMGTAIVEVTGLRTPCYKLDRFQPGLMAATIDRDERGKPIFKAGIMGIVLADGEVRAGDRIRIEPPPGPHRPLKPV